MCIRDSSSNAATVTIEPPLVADIADDSGVTYDCLNFESQIIHSRLWENIFSKLKSENLVKLEKAGKNEGCWVISSKNEDDKILVRSNGVATYIAKDIPYAAWKLGIINDPFNYKIFTTQENNQTLYETTLDEHDKEET